MTQPNRHEAEDERVLTPEIREHLARKLRAEYSLEADKPAFLGDTALPPQFERYVQKLRTIERTSEAGLDAIRREFGLRPGDEDPTNGA